jgi:four helix bundle protein
MSDYKELEVWKKSRALAAAVYRSTASFPGREMFGLTKQMRTAATSIVFNIAEGHGRWSRRDCRALLTIARGSAFELETQTYIAEDLDFVTHADAEALRNAVIEVARMLHGLIRYYSKLLKA